MSRHGGPVRSAIASLLHSSILFRPHQQPRFKPRLMVEAPGYCPPGPKCLFHATVYRHSRLPGTNLDREFQAQAQGLALSLTHIKSPKGGGIGARTADMEGHSISLTWGHKDMKKLVFVIGGAA